MLKHSIFYSLFFIRIGLLIFEMDAHDAVSFSVAVIAMVILYRVLT